MKELLTAELVGKLVKGDAAAASCIIFRDNVLNGFAKGAEYPRVLLLEFPRHTFVELGDLLRAFPSLWWADFSGNNIRVLKLTVGAKAMGKLNLSQNPVSPDAMNELRSMHILRLHVPLGASSEVASVAAREEFCKNMPLVWVLNNDYIPFQIRRDFIFDASAATNSWAPVWETSSRQSQREYNLLLAAQEFPNTAHLMESSRLDVLLEDYLDEAWVYNNYLTRTRSNLPEMSVVNCTKILNLSHSQRIDLSAVLTLAIVVDVPVDIFAEGLQKHFSYYYSIPELEHILRLPVFVKTALVNLIRRICKQEKFELDNYQCLTVRAKSSSTLFSDDLITYQSANFLSADGFRHLFECRKYLEYSTVPNLDPASDRTPFSDLECDILRVLPDIPTRADALHIIKKGSASSYSDWVSFSGRHTVVLLRRAVNLPSLTRVPSSQLEQQVYLKLLPVLQIAKMSYDDLAIANTGASFDGRVDVKGSSKVHLGTNLLPYGAGIPDGAPKQLVWNQSSIESKVHTRKMSVSNMTDDLSNEIMERSELDLNSIGNHDIIFTDATLTNVSNNDVMNVSHTGETSRRESTDITIEKEASYVGSANVVVIETPDLNVVPNVSSTYDEFKTPAFSVLSPKPVSGFSSDLRLGPAFILAPERAIEEHNRDVSEALDGWRPLEVPPVFIQPADVSGFRDTMRLSHSPITTERDGFEVEYTRRADEGMNDDASRSEIFQYSVGSENYPPSRVDETLRGLKLLGDDTTYSRSPVASTRRRSSARVSFADQDPIPKPKVQFSIESRNGNDVISVKRERLDPIDAAKELLKEMGTFRNLRNLAKFNKDHATPGGQGRAAAKTVHEESSIITARLTKSLDENSWMRSVHLRAKQLTSEKPIETKSDSAFLTSLQGDGGDESQEDDDATSKVSSLAMANYEVAEKYISSLSERGSAEYGTKLPLLKATIVQQARTSLNYPFVYSDEANIDRGDMASSGKQISPHWFPRQDKVIYRIPSSSGFGAAAARAAPEDPFQHKLMKALPSSSPVRYISKTRAPAVPSISAQSGSRQKEAKPASLFRGRGLPSERAHVTPGLDVINRLVKANEDFFGASAINYPEMETGENTDAGMENDSKHQDQPAESSKANSRAPSARNGSPERVIVTPAPVFRGVEGSATDGIYGNTIDALSVFRPASARLELNRSFKLMKNRPPDEVVVAGQKLESQN